MSDFLVEILKTYGLGAVALGALVYIFWKLLVVFLDEDKSALWRGQFYRAAYWVTGKRDKEKKYISNDIKGRLNLARRKMHFGQSLLPTAIDIEWLEGAAPEAYDIKDGEFVVRLDPSGSQVHNISTFAVLLVQKTALRGLRSSLDNSVTCAIDMNLARNLIFELANREVLDWFLANEFVKATHCTAECEKMSERIRVLDERGFFTRLLLVELEELSEKVYGMGPSVTVATEVGALIHFLYSLATKEPGKDVPLELNLAHVRVGMILVAKTGTILEYGIDPYIHSMESHINRGMETVYLLAFDKDWLGEVNAPAHEAFKGKVSKLKSAMLTRTMAQEEFSDDFLLVDRSGKRRKALCIRYKF